MLAQCAVAATVRDVLRACGACELYVSCDCAMCGARLVCVRCLGNARHDADEPLWCVGLIVSCMPAHACVMRW
jgi:hypothetical protein